MWSRRPSEADACLVVLEHFSGDPKAVEKLALYEANEENDPDREMVFLDAKTDLERELKRNEEELRQAIAREREEEVKRSLCVSKSTDRWVGPLLPKVHERFLSGDRSLTIQDTINKHVFLKKIENQQVTFYKVACRILICRDIRRYGETLAAMRDSVISVTDALERFREEENRKFLARQVAVMVQDFWFSFHRGEVGSPSLRHFAVKFYLSLDIVNEEVGLYRERPLSNQLFNSVDEQLLRLQEESQVRSLTLPGRLTGVVDDSAWILRADFMEYDAQPMHQDLLPPLLIRKRKRFRDDLMSPRRAAFALESDCLLRGSYQRAQRPTTSRRQSTGSGKTGNHGHEMGVGNGGCRGLLPTFSSDSLPPAPGPVPLLGPSYPTMGRGSSAMIAASPIQTWSLFDPPVTTHFKLCRENQHFILRGINGVPRLHSRVVACEGLHHFSVTSREQPSDIPWLLREDESL
ncbi:unnamed protein product, partial [Cyprideis torosa]